MNLSVVERKTRLIGAILVERRLITPEQLRDALELQAERGGLLGEIVTEEFGVSAVEVSQVIAERLADLEADTGDDPSSAATRPQLRFVGPPEDAESHLRIGDVLVDLGLVESAQIDAALAVQQKSGERLGEILVGQGVISRLELAGALSEHWASLTKLRGPGEPGPVPAVASDVLSPGHDELVALFERLEAKLDAFPSGAVSDVDTAAALERISARLDELTPAPSDHLAAEVNGRSGRFEELLAGELEDRFERLGARLDELAAAVPSEQLGALGEGQRRGEEALGHVASELAGFREAVEARLASLAGDGELASQFERLSVKVDELVAAVPSDRLEERLTALDDGHRRGEGVLGRVESELAALREEMDARLELVAGSAGDGELARKFERLSLKVEELVAAAPLDQLGVLGEGQRRGEEVLGRVESELAGLREEMDARLELVAGSAGGSQELSAEVARLSAKVEGLVAAAPLDQLGVLGEGQRRGEEVLGRVVSELAGLRHEMDAKLELVAGSAGAGGEISAEVARLSVKVDELVAAAPSDLLEERLRSLDEGQRRGEDALGRVGSELAGLREEASAKLGEGESVIDVVRTLMTDVGRLSDTLAELGAGTNEELLTGHLERLDTRLDAVGNAVPADQLALLGEGQRRGQEVLERLFSELAALRDQTDARLDSELAALRDHTDARLDAIVSAEAERSKAFAGELEAVAAVLEGVGTGLEERGAGRHRELAERLERLSARIEELSAVVPADELVNRIDVLGEAQRRAENTLERLVAELEPGRDEAQAAPVPTELAGVSPDTRPQKKEKKKKKKKH